MKQRRYALEMVRNSRIRYAIAREFSSTAWLLRGSCVALQFTARVPSSRTRWLRRCCVRRLGLRTSCLRNGIGIGIGISIGMAAAEEWEDVLEEEREEEADSEQDGACVEQEAAPDLRCSLRHVVARVLVRLR